MKQLYISQPTLGRSDEEISVEQEYVKLAAERILKEEIEIIDSFPCGDIVEPLEYLGENLKLLAKANYVWFCEGWELDRNCKIESLCVREYGIPILHC